MRKIHVFVVCWLSKEKNAEQIVQDVSGVADYVNVIYSTPNINILHDDDIWVQLPEECYYGAKVAVMLERFKGDILLQIHADSYHENWAAIVERCRYIHSNLPQIGVWAPDVDNTPFLNEYVEIVRDDQWELSYVINTDGIVWSFSSAVVARLKKFDYSQNKYGHGIDWAAISFSFTNNLFVARDLIFKIHHEKGTSYNRPDATRQAYNFLSQLDKQETTIFRILDNYVTFQIKYPQSYLTHLSDVEIRAGLLVDVANSIFLTRLRFLPPFFYEPLSKFLLTLGSILGWGSLRDKGEKIWNIAQLNKLEKSHFIYRFTR